MMEENKKVVVYSNGAGISMQLHDLNIKFNISFPDGTVEEKANVFMSPQHAKMFSKVLAEHIVKYEEVFGYIPTEPSQDELVALQEKGLVTVDERFVGK
jgi:cobalamin-dependent methionine synthase I